MGEPLWSARTWMVIPVRGLLTATMPSLPPDKIISPVGREEKRRDTSCRRKKRPAEKGPRL